jgi:hypothetical protein
MIRIMPEESEIHLNTEISKHFRLLKNATYAFGSFITLCLIPLIGLLWSLKAEQIQMSKDFIKQEEVYNNFVNKGQYIYLQGESIELQLKHNKNIDISEDLKSYGQKIKDVLDIRYRGMRNE